MLRRWWWIPLAFLGLLLLKAWMLAGMLQGTAQGLAVGATGLPAERVEIVDGLDVRLTGFSDQASADVAVAQVEELDSSWDVTAVVDEAAAPVAVEEEEPETTEAPAATPAVVPAALTMTAAAGAVVLEGTVANEEVRAGIVDQAIESFGTDNVTDNLVIDPDAVAPEGGTMTITGLAESEEQRQEWISGAELTAAQGGLALTDNVEVAEATVEQQLNALFELEPIEFDTSRATIRGTSEPTLDAAAEVINENPDAGRLRVVGHTDSDGSDAANQDLSQRRAQAVIDYLVNVRGVEADRLEADGRGETELKVDPETTPEDKQRNRRIEWELIG